MSYSLYRDRKSNNSFYCLKSSILCFYLLIYMVYHYSDNPFFYFVSFPFPQEHYLLNKHDEFLLERQVHCKLVSRFTSLPRSCRLYMPFKGSLSTPFPYEPYKLLVVLPVTTTRTYWFSLSLSSDPFCTFSSNLIHYCQTSNDIPEIENDSLFPSVFFQKSS